MINNSEEKSRTQVKKEAESLQKLGEQLLTLNKNQLNNISIPLQLKEAIIHANTITSKKAKHRQKQFIGALMREIDPEPLIKELEYIDTGIPIDSSANTQAKKWHTLLMEGDNSPIESVRSDFPEADHQKLRQLIQNARKKKEQAKSGKASQNLLKYLKEISAQK